MKDKKSGIGSHHSANMKKDEWLTPPDVIEALGRFDLDPCSPINKPWATAKNHFSIKDDGLSQIWSGRVWCNPPYGLEAARWLNKLKNHKDGIALIFARTETKMFFDHVWNDADALLFIEGRLYFHHVDGSRAKANSGAPSVLIAYGKSNAEILKNCKIKGKYIQLS
ncbi:DNA N-6-adenine-methyltransferase (Dam) [Chryseobacterium sp. MOF25P]|uniref:DNA N-6-adenine-methyltransferase n=1 Tax=unclassified Chryseobacterium TaxID=2593645 RepID=UPI0008048BA7|nr:MULTISPECIES: DNA N-6-adenine-methyltransferase [unclassified Chryseobacterium]OBW43511.1 DNA N-6-adenine-methyltransferase (Dam) [Chryseobacterium sp. MOF25P]OBW46715.1 DNA N-6-adenine-methyltransferase (Dam) [Chryseobacterium sp. BGARF1]